MKLELSSIGAAVSQMPFGSISIGLLLLNVTLILAIAFVADRAVARFSAAQRHYLWSVALGSVLVLPVLTVILPALDVRIKSHALVMSVLRVLPGEGLLSPPLGMGQRAGSYPAIGTIPLTPVDASSDDQRQFRAISFDHNTFAKTPVLSGDSSVNIEKALAASFLIWFLGAIAMLARLANAHRTLRSVVKRAHTISDSVVAECASQIAERLQLARHPRVLMHPSITTPCMAGWRRPVVLLPETSSEWSRERMHAVLSHELAHVSRNDYLMQMLAAFTCAVYWVHPLVWIAASKLRNACERAADDCAIAGMPSVLYAHHLLALADNSARARSTPTVALGMARVSQLETRICAMLNSTLSRRTFSRNARRFTSVSAVLVLVPLSALCTGSGADDASSSATSRARFDGGASQHIAAPVAASETRNIDASSDSVVDRTINVGRLDIFNLKIESIGELTLHASSEMTVRVRAVTPRELATGQDIALKRLTNGAELRVSDGMEARAGRRMPRYEIWLPERTSIFVQSISGGTINQLTIAGLKNAGGINEIRIDGAVTAACASAIFAHVVGNLHNKLTCGPFAFPASGYQKLGIIVNGVARADSVQTLRGDVYSGMLFARTMRLSLPGAQYNPDLITLEKDTVQHHEFDADWSRILTTDWTRRP